MPEKVCGKQGGLGRGVEKDVAERESRGAGPRALRARANSCKEAPSTDAMSPVWGRGRGKEASGGLWGQTGKGPVARNQVGASGTLDKAEGTHLAAVSLGK